MNDIQFNTGVIRPVECMKEGWALIKGDYWIFFAVNLVGMLIAGLIPLGVGIGAMFCGIYLVVMRRADGERYEFGDLFKGFNYFVPGLIVTVVLIVPLLFSMILAYGTIVGGMFAAMKPNGQLDEAKLMGVFAAFAVEMIIISLISGTLHALLMFSYPLIVDRGLGGVDALKLSFRAVWANLSGVVGIILVEFAMGFVGYLALGFGLYFVLPIMFAGVFVAYRKVFPKGEANYAPPSPDIYSI